MIRIGRCKYDSHGKRTDPTYPNFTPILVMMKGHSQWGILGPYDLVDDKNRTVENIYQFSKLYKKVPATTQHYSRWNNKVIWSHPAETHYSNDIILPAYWQWREKGMNNPYAVRYPAGYTNRHSCLFSIKEGSTDHLDYIDARKQIYVPTYCELVKKQPKFIELKNKLANGENLLIIEVDGPHQESLSYYQETWNVDDNFIENDTILASEENINIMLNDDKHSFGHGYCLAMALLDMEKLAELK